MAIQTPRRTLATARGLIIDIALPVVLFYGLRGLGVSELNALIVGMIPPFVHGVVSAIRKRSINVLSALVLLGMLLGLVAGLISGNPRELLIRNAWISAPLSVVTLASLWARRPINFTVTRDLMPRRAATMDRLWDTDEGFRLAWRRITIVWGILMLVDAALRILIAVTLPIGMVPVIDGVITAVTIVALQLPTHLFMLRTGHWWEVFGPPARFAPPHRRPVESDSVPAACH